MTAHTVQARASEWLMSDSGDGGDQLVRDLSDELASLAADVTRQRIVNAELVVERDCIRGERDRLAALNARLTEALAATTDELEHLARLLEPALNNGGVTVPGLATVNAAWLAVNRGLSALAAAGKGGRS